MKILFLAKHKPFSENAAEIVKLHVNEAKVVFDHESIELLDSLNLSMFKIPSGEITNLPYLRHIGKMGKPVILSSGMANLGEIETVLDILISELKFPLQSWQWAQP